MYFAISFQERKYRFSGERSSLRSTWDPFFKGFPLLIVATGVGPAGAGANGFVSGFAIFGAVAIFISVSRD
jgi:hypothetical protein